MRNVWWGMLTFTDIIDRWPSISIFARDIGVGYVTAQTMRYRDQISSKRWHDVVKAAQKRGLDVSYETLAEIAASKKKQPPRRRSKSGAACAA